MKLFFLLLFVLNGQAAELSPAVYLMKLHERITGKWPEPKEYDSLHREMKRTHCSSVSCLKPYFRSQIEALMKEPEFYQWMILLVYEKMGFRAPMNPQLILSNADFSSSEDIVNFLIFRTVMENRSIDELFTSQKYWNLVPKTYSSNTGIFEPGGFKIQQDKAPRSKTVFVKIPIGEGAFREEKLKETDYSGHPNVSGLLSTIRFLNRYWNSPVNQNRKRASAIFKSMLCDSLTPSLEREGEKDREKRMALGISEISTERSAAELQQNRHASQSDCRQCHSRLDPLARTMRPMELGLSNESVPGKLRFFSAFNELTEVPADNFHDIIGKITKQDKYLECQVQWLVEKIIGKDVVLLPNRFGDLTRRFERDGRRLKSFIADLLLAPEFIGEDTKFKEDSTFSGAQRVFMNCYHCHGNFVMGQTSSYKSKIKNIAEKLDLAHGGKNRQMPPMEHFWAPSSEDLGMISAWIKKGAPIASRKPILTKQEIEFILAPPVKEGSAGRE